MDLRYVYTFYRAATLKSITAAAAELRIVPGAAAKRIRELENDLRVALLDRRPDKQFRLRNRVPAGGPPRRSCRYYLPGVMGHPTILVAPSHLEPFADDPDHVRVVVETPRGDRNKLSYDEELGIFRLKKVLPEGMSFPYDFGFVPSTLAEDGDPIDALVLMDEPATTGCLVECRLVGVIEGEQRDEGSWTRNDRLIAVAVPSHTHGSLKSLKDLDGTLLKELEQFFVNYHDVVGNEFRLLGCKGPKGARRLLDQAIKAHRKRQKQSKVKARGARSRRSRDRRS